MSDGSSDVCSSDLLVDFAATANVQRLWSVKVGEGEGRLGSRQAPAIADGHVYAAALEGGVGAWDLQSGSALWRTESELRLSSGPGVGDDTAVVGSLEGDVVALDADPGAQKWTAQGGTEVLAAPAGGPGYVRVRWNDGRTDGRRLGKGG